MSSTDDKNSDNIQYYHHDVKPKLDLSVRVVIMIAGFAASGLLLFQIIRWVKTRKKELNGALYGFITNLFVASFLWLCVLTPADVYVDVWEIHHDWTVGEAMCRLFYYLQSILLYSSNYFTVILVFYQSACVLFPKTLVRFAKWQWSALVSSLVWAVVLLGNLHELFNQNIYRYEDYYKQDRTRSIVASDDFNSSQSTEYDVHICYPTAEGKDPLVVFTAFVLCAHAVPCLLMLFGTVFLAAKLQLHLQHRARQPLDEDDDGSTNEQNEPKSTNHPMNTTILVVMLTTVKFFSSLPYLIFIIVYFATIRYHGFTVRTMVLLDISIWSNLAYPAVFMLVLVTFMLKQPANYSDLFEVSENKIEVQYIEPKDRARKVSICIKGYVEPCFLQDT